MIGYTHTLKKLGFSIGQELATDFILTSLLSSYGSFISNYHMHDMHKGLNELCGILKTAKTNIKKNARNHVMIVQKTYSFKKKGKSWAKKVGKGMATDVISKSKPQSVPKTGPDAETVCFFYQETGHWKRNYKKCQASLKKKSESQTFTSGILVINIIDIFLTDTPSNYWVFDTGSVVYACNSMQRLIRSRIVASDEPCTPPNIFSSSIEY